MRWSSAKVPFAALDKDYFLPCEWKECCEMDGAMVGIIGTDRGYGVSYATFGTDTGYGVSHAVFGKRCKNCSSFL